ncbi:AMP-binding protein [Sulfobacillus harzensis]|uniref:Long-chain fatty acid--CoA ligase n=1 Tax=Sulfobacillus harzensis TaxID=2729629 RepID=A0A7Y0L765_9FIRM|nr:AMP-binding protein [Sulfobacillus harzensis]NMP24569.1 long-chain fatty acid--CoA ligase [Sulfobacillus harzensis]
MRSLLVHETLRDAAYQYESTPVVSSAVTYTYGSIYERTVRLADSLTRLGIRRGTMVGVMDVNSHRYFELHHALSMVGAVIHTINFRLSPQDILWTIGQAHDEWLFLWNGFGTLTDVVAPACPHVVWMSEAAGPDREPDYETLVAEGRFRVPDIAGTIAPSDVYSVFYTTGTTGRPKGIRYTHQQMLSGALQIAHALALQDTGANLTGSDVIMPLIPFFHIHGWGVPFIAPYLGAPLVLPERSGPEEQVELIRQHEVTWSNMVPTQLFMLLEATSDPLPLKVLTGGSPLSSGLARQADRQGIQFSLIYGGSDQLGSAISAAPGLTGPQRLDALGSRLTPFPMVRMEVRDSAANQVPSDGATLGELWIQSPWLPDGYLDNPEASDAAFVGGWFRSGDLAVRYPDGQISVMDRIKDAIKSGGEWVAGSVIESIISELPGVHSVAVIAIPDARWGERPKAVIAAGSGVDADRVQQALSRAVDEGRLAKFWIPDVMEFVESLPMTSAGKINKTQLRNASR